MANTSALITLHSVVKNLQNYTEMGDKMYLKLLGMAGRGVRQINMFHDSKIVEVDQSNLSELTNGVYPYPEDCLKIIDVFYSGDGRLIPMSRRRDLVYKDTHNLPLPYTKSVESVDERKDTYRGKFAVGGGRNKYYYKDDAKGRRVIFDMVMDQDFWVYYVSTGVDSSLGEQTLIPAFYQDYLEFFILAKLAALRNNKRDAEFYERRAIRESTRIKYFRLPALNEIMDAVYETIYQGPKR